MFLGARLFLFGAEMNAGFVNGIRELISEARTTVARGVDLIQVRTNFEIGRRIGRKSRRGGTGRRMVRKYSAYWPTG